MVTGAGYLDLTTTGHHMSESATDQLIHPYYPQNAVGHGFPAYQRMCYCKPFPDNQPHTQQCLELNINMYNAFVQTWQASMEQTQQHPGGNLQPPFQPRGEDDVQMNDVEHVNRGKMEEVKPGEEQAHPGGTGTVPQDEDGGKEMVVINEPAAETGGHGGHDQGGAPSPRAQGGSGGNPREPTVNHECCNTGCPTGKYVSHDGTAEKKANVGFVRKIFQVLGIASEYDEQHDPVSAIKDRLRRDKEDLEKRLNGVQIQSQQKSREHKEALRRRDEELRWMDGELKSKEAELKRKEGGWMRKEAELEGANAKFQRDMKMLDNQIANLNSKVMEYQGKAERLGGQLSALEQSNSKSAVGTGAHRDSHAIPPNLMYAAFDVTSPALAFTKTFYTFLRGRKALETHPALQTVPPGADERCRRYALESYICSRLFAGFENDSYLDSLDCTQSSPYLPENYEQGQFFLLEQDPKLRHRRYIVEYEALKKLSLPGVMETMKKEEATTRWNTFHQFCCRKWVSIVGSLDGWFEEFDLAPDATNILHQLATNPKYSDKFLKPFVNLALMAFMLHRLAFQFHPPARIFRYAPGTPFNKDYMKTAGLVDDDEPVEGCVVGHMLIPGFQVGATIVKCTVYLVPSPPKPSASGPAK